MEVLNTFECAESPRISVIIPVYNAGCTVQRCLDSVVNQSYKYLEIIVVIDGATDNSLEICRDYEAKDNRIKLYVIDNHGVSYSRNLALDHASGDYVCFLDSDDWIEPDMYERMVSCAQNYVADVVIQPFIFEGCYRTHTSVSSNDNIVMNGKEAAIEMLNGKMFSGQLCNKMFRSTYISDLHCDPSVLVYEDIMALWHIFPKCNVVVYQDRYCYHYIMNQTSAMHQRYNSKYAIAKNVANNILADAHSMFNDAIPYASKLAIQVYRMVMHRAYESRNEEGCSFKREYSEFRNCVKTNFNSDVKSIIGSRELLSLKIECSGMFIFLTYQLFHSCYSAIKRLLVKPVCISI